MILLDEYNFPVLVTDGEEVPIVAPIEEFLPGRVFHFAFEEGDQVVTVEVDLERLVPGLATLHALSDDVGITCRGSERRKKVLVCKEVIEDRARLDYPGPTNDCRHSVATFPIGGLLTAVGSTTAVADPVDSRPKSFSA